MSVRLDAVNARAAGLPAARPTATPSNPTDQVRSNSPEPDLGLIPRPNPAKASVWHRHADMVGGMVAGALSSTLTFLSVLVRPRVASEVPRPETERLANELHGILAPYSPLRTLGNPEADLRKFMDSLARQGGATPEEADAGLAVAVRDIKAAYKARTGRDPEIDIRSAGLGPMPIG